MKGFLLHIWILLLFCGALFAQDGQIGEPLQDGTVSLVFAGDIMGHSPQYKAAYNAKTNTFNYDICFQGVKEYIETADLAIANLEVPVAGMPYSGYPNFSSPDALLDGLKNAGYDILLTANNHVLDRGKSGHERTLRQIKQRNMRHVGSYIDKIQRDSTYPLIMESKGVKIAFLNYTYGTNGHVVSKPNIVNYIDTLLIISDLQKADSLGADIKVMTVHWGNEYELNANEWQQKMARFFVDRGVDLIIGSHPHVVQNAETWYRADSVPIPVYYSLGNSISNQRNLHTDGGIMVKVSIDSATKKILNSSYLPVYVHKGHLHGKYQYHLIPTTGFTENPTHFPITKADSTSLRVFDYETRKRLNNMNVPEFRNDSLQAQKTG